jgi:hypothetical protein
MLPTVWHPLLLRMPNPRQRGQRRASRSAPGRARCRHDASSGSPPQHVSVSSASPWDRVRCPCRASGADTPRNVISAASQLLRRCMASRTKVFRRPDARRCQKHRCLGGDCSAKRRRFGLRYGRGLASGDRAAVGRLFVSTEAGPTWLRGVPAELDGVSLREALPLGNRGRGWPRIRPFPPSIGGLPEGARRRSLELSRAEVRR